MAEIAIDTPGTPGEAGRLTEKTNGSLELENASNEDGYTNNKILLFVAYSIWFLHCVSTLGGSLLEFHKIDGCIVFCSRIPILGLIVYIPWRICNITLRLCIFLNHLYMHNPSLQENLTRMRIYKLAIAQNMYNIYNPNKSPRLYKILYDKHDIEMWLTKMTLLRKQNKYYLDTHYKTKIILSHIDIEYGSYQTSSILIEDITISKQACRVSNKRYLENLSKLNECYDKRISYMDKL